MRSMLLHFSIATMVVFSLGLAWAQDPKPPDAIPPPPPEQAPRLGITEIKKSMKFETIKSDKTQREYDVVVDEDAAKETGYTPQEIKNSLIEAMDSRTDGKEDNQLSIETTDTPKESEVKEAPPEGQPKKPESVPDLNKRLVAKIKKKVKPDPAHSDSKLPAVKDFDLDGKRTMWIKSEGACEAQNKGLRDSFKLPPPTP